MLRLPLLATFILLPFLLCAQESPLPQTRLVDLAKEYQLNAANGSEPVGTLFQGARAMEERFPSWVAHWQAAGRDLASLQQISLLACAWNDAVLKAGKQLYGPQAEPIEFLLPHGVFQVDFPLMLMPGTFRATGGATVLVVDPSDWAGAPGEASGEEVPETREFGHGGPIAGRGRFDLGMGNPGEWHANTPRRPPN